MTQFDNHVHSISPDFAGSRIFKFIAFLYGIAAYLVFFVTVLYAIGFVMGLVVPRASTPEPIRPRSKPSSSIFC